MSWDDGVIFLYLHVKVKPLHAGEWEKEKEKKKKGLPDLHCVTENVTAHMNYLTIEYLAGNRRDKTGSPLDRPHRTGARIHLENPFN